MNLRDEASAAARADRAAPRLLQELSETLQRLRLGGPFYLLLWLLSGWAAGLWQGSRLTFVVVAMLYALLAWVRFLIRPLPEHASTAQAQRQLRLIWVVLLINAATWGIAAAWLLMYTQDESARTVVAVSCYAFATAFAHNFAMRARYALLAVALLMLPALAAYVANGSRLELVVVIVLYLLYITLALRRSHGEYLQRLDLEDELRAQRDLFQQQSRRDGLTGLANRRRFSAVLAEWVAVARAKSTPLALLILDLDHFKDVNDHHGHATGDACLRAFADRLQQHFDEPRDMVARLGGEEFGVLLRDCTLDEAVSRAEAFRIALADTPLPLEGRELAISVSIGVATVVPVGEDDSDTLYRAADAALYAAKESGRNAVRRADALP